MNATDEVTVGLFGDVRKACHTVLDLLSAGFQDGQLGLIVRPDCVESIARCKRPLVLHRTRDALIFGGLFADLCHGDACALEYGLTGILCRLGLTEEEAQDYKNEFVAGRSLVIICAAQRAAEAAALLARQSYSTLASHASGVCPQR